MRFPSNYRAAAYLLVCLGQAFSQTQSGKDSGKTAKAAYWLDLKTRLMWTAADNGSGVTYSQAVYFCRSLDLGGYHNWSLPSIDDLQKLFGGPPDPDGHRISAPIKLTGWEWSSSPGKEPGERWGLDFGDGGRASLVMGDSGLNRALCVRRSDP